LTERKAAAMFTELPPERSAEMKAADDKVSRLIDDIKRINATNASLLDRYAEMFEKNTAEFQRKFAELSKQLLGG
jgi:hypothetical protein